MQNIPCKQCTLIDRCAYPYIFETPLPATANKMTRYTSVPHPFVLNLPFRNQHKSTLDIGFCLFGKANDYLPHFTHALEQAGKKRIGSYERLRLIKIEQNLDLATDQWGEIKSASQPLAPYAPVCPHIPSVPEEVAIHFLTPFRLLKESSNIQTEEFEFPHLFSSLLRRISMLTYFHTDTPLDTDFAQLSTLAGAIQFKQKKLVWQDWQRHSSRQTKYIKMGGLMGTVNLSLRGAEKFWPYLWLGQWTHAGKATSMGLGQYKLECSTASLRAATSVDG